MAQTLLGTTPVSLKGEIPAIGSTPPGFSLVTNDLKNVSLADYADKKIILNIFPSIDTSVCATSVRQFNQRAAKLDDVVILCIAKDLPFAMKRFCAAEGIDKVITLSDFRDPDFANNYGVEMADGAFAGLMARAIVVIKQGKVTYSELVPFIGQEPDYAAALRAIN